MLFGNKKKPRERFYLLPGQGGRSFHRKQKLFIRWAVGVSLVGGLLIGLVIWWMSKPKL